MIIQSESLKLCGKMVEVFYTTEHMVFVAQIVRSWRKYMWEKRDYRCNNRESDYLKFGLKNCHGL